MYITLDVGGTYVRVAGFLDTHTDTEPLFLEKFAHEPSYEKDIEKVLSIIKKGPKRVVDGVAVSLAGFIGEDGQTLMKSPNLPTWNKTKPAKDLSHELQSKGVLINDAVAGAMGEARYGLRPEQDFVYLIWGTGIGGALCKQKKHLSWFASDLEPGHSILLVDSLDHAKHESWERLNGGAALEARFSTSVDQLPDIAWDTVEREMADGITALLEQLSVETLIINGGVAMNQKERVKEIEAIVEHSHPEVKIHFSSLKDVAGLYGGLAFLE